MILTQEPILAEALNHPMRIGSGITIRGGQILGLLQDI